MSGNTHGPALIGAALGWAVLAAATPAAETLAAPAQVCHVLVTSNRVEDVSSMEAWKASFIKDGMSDEQKALAVWTTVVKFRHQEPPPIEFLQAEDHVHDPIKTFNVYGYGQCCCASADIEALARSIGLQARGWGINNHSVPEIFWDGSWHLLDASLIDYFPKADGKLAGVEEIIASVSAWLDKHPEFKAKPDAAYPFGKGGNWRTQGPEVLARSPFYDINGWLPAATHGWYSTIQEYNGHGGGDGKAFLYDYGYSQGYQLNLQFRRGEKLVRRWSNQGLHVNMGLKDGGPPGCLSEKVGTDQLRYSPAYGDLANERIGNGTLVYDLPMAVAELTRAALTADNLDAAAGADGAMGLTPKDATKPGTLVIGIPSSYVYLAGQLEVARALPAGGACRIEISDNNGLDWNDVPASGASGVQHADIGSLIARRYDVRLRITLSGQGSLLQALRFSADIQHSQRALPALGQGANLIHVVSGAQEGTITVEGSTSLAGKGRQLVYTDFHPEVVGMAPGSLRLAAGTGSVTFPVHAPGDILRVRFGCNYRARDAHDGWDLQVSTDHGTTFTTVERAAGPTGNGSSRYVTFSAIPPGTRDLLVRFTGQQVNTTMISGFRIDADYRAPAAGFIPMAITYAWMEGGREHSDVHVTAAADERYTLTCAEKPAMLSLTMEPAH